MTKAEVLAKVEQIGIIPAIRVASEEDAFFAAEVVALGGIPILEVTMTVPNAMHVISALVRNHPDVIVGAGTVLDGGTARACVGAGVSFLTSTGLDLEVVEYAVKEEIAVFPGALTPTEVIRASRAGADMVKVYPCAQVGGPSYIRALKAPLPQVPLIASGGVNQQTAEDFIRAGASALGIGGELIPHEAINKRQDHRIRELARRFLGLVKYARQLASS